jgi:hypothetical protein
MSANLDESDISLFNDSKNAYFGQGDACGAFPGQAMVSAAKTLRKWRTTAVFQNRF